ncbi:hypothetical protein ACOMHN_003041 [Nucella lapillus]
MADNPCQDGQHRTSPHVWLVLQTITRDKMAGRGRGRGMGQVLTVSLDSMGLTRSDLSQSQPKPPPPLYKLLAKTPVPNTDYCPESLKQLEVSRSIRKKLRQKHAHLTLADKHRDIQRYSDKYHQQDELGWTPTDWSRFPAELRPAPQRQRKARNLNVKPNLKAALARPRRKADNSDGAAAEGASQAEILARAKERLSTASTETADKEDEEEEEEEVVEEEFEEEELQEDETDYNQAYFDNGEGYGDDDDDDEEHAYS